MTRMTSFPVKPAFDPKRDYVVKRRITVNAADYASGDQFKKAEVNPRLLRQLYDRGDIAMAELVKSGTVTIVEKNLLPRVSRIARKPRIAEAV